VTQVPPWNEEGSAKIELTIPKPAAAPTPAVRRRADSIEEITGSAFLVEDGFPNATQTKAAAEDLSASYLIPEEASQLAKAEPEKPPALKPPSLSSDTESFRTEPLTADDPKPPIAALESPSVEAFPVESSARELSVEGTSPAGRDPATATTTVAMPTIALPALKAPPSPPDTGSITGEEGGATALPTRERPPEPTGAVAPPSPSSRLIHDLTEIWAEKAVPRARRSIQALRDLWEAPKERWILVLFGSGTLLILVGLFGAVFRIASPGPAARANTPWPATAPPSTPGPSATSSPNPSEPSPTAVPDSATSSRTAEALPCGLGGGATRSIAPKAHIRSGVEAVASHDRIALGFVVSDKEGLAVAIEPTSLAATTTAKQRTREPIRRLVPELSGKGVVAIAEIEHKGERISNARTVFGDVKYVLGEAEGKLVWGAQANDAPHALWSLDGDGPVEALRTAALDDGGAAIAFRQGSSIYIGAISPEKVPRGSLSRIAGLGSQIGSPTIAASSNIVIVAWADRASTSDPWMLRLVRWQPGDDPGGPRTFAIPSGGLGEQAMSPAIVGVAGGRFLLSWTEGPAASHQVRAQTLTASGEALGAPLTISGEGINAGQGQAALLPDGQGVVAYLASPAGSSAEVVATPVQCPGVP